MSHEFEGVDYPAVIVDRRHQTVPVAANVQNHGGPSARYLDWISMRINLSHLGEIPPRSKFRVFEPGGQRRRRVGELFPPP